jgi:predicted nucleic acid-binding Zn ribbon protein
MVGSISEHAHCLMCGKSIPFGETLCSEECKQKYHTLLKRRKIIVYACSFNCYNCSWWTIFLK